MIADLFAFVAELPRESFVVSLQKLVDDLLEEFEPLNKLAFQEIAAYRAIGPRRFEMLVRFSDAGDEITILLTPTEWGS